MLDKPTNGLPRTGGGRRGSAWRLASALLAVFLGVALFGKGSRRSALEDGVPTSLPVLVVELTGPTNWSVIPTSAATLSRQRAVTSAWSHGVDDDQPAGACWLASVGEAPPSCVCSAGTVEDLTTPGFMRSLLASWRDAGQISGGELRERLREVDAACASREGAP